MFARLKEYHAPNLPPVPGMLLISDVRMRPYPLPEGATMLTYTKPQRLTYIRLKKAKHLANMHNVRTIK